jgi:4-amino-4-deoxy-L-arabinose transferase-like glycosyltransferase
MTVPGGGGRAGPAHRLAVAAILAAALALRLAGNTYGLPHAYAPDEVAKIETARSLIGRDFAHPTTQPSFLYYSLFVITAIGDPVHGWLGRHGLVDARVFPPGDPLPFDIWLGRCFLAVLGTLTVWVVYRLGREIGGRATGTLAAAVYALAPLPIAATQYLKEDTPLALWTAATLLFAVRAQRSGRRDHLLAGAAAAGLAFASKYAGAAAVVIVLVAALVAPAASGRRVRRAATDIAAILGVFLLTFALACPVLATRPQELLGSVGSQTRYLERGHHDGIAVSGGSQAFTFYLRRAVGPGLGWPAFLAAAAGAAVLWRRRRGAAVLVGLWALGYAAVAEAMPAKPYPFFARYVLPAIPPLAALAGVAMAALAGAARARGRSPTARALAAVAATLVLAPLAVRAAAVAATALPDTRDQARAWVLANVPAGAVLWVTPYAPPIGPARFAVRPLDQERLGEARRARPGSEHWVMLVSFYTDRYLENPSARPHLSSFLGELQRGADGGPTFRNRWVAFGYANPVVRVFPVR